MTVGTATQFLAHGIEGRRDLPLPLDLLVQGGVLALLASFFGLGLLWRSPRLRAGAAGRPVPLPLEQLVDGTGFRWLLRLVGLLGTAYVLATAALMEDDVPNPLPYVVYVLFWVGIVPLSLLFGPVWRLVNPLRTIHALLAGLTRIPAGGLVSLPRWVGCWPAALSLLSFVWLELAAPDRDAVPVLLAYLGSYAAVHVGAALLFGDRWFATCDGFEVYSAVVGTMSPLGRRDDGRLVLRNPLDGAATFGPAPGVVVLIAVLLGSTFFDTISGSAQWAGAVQSVPLPATLLDTAGLLVMIALVAVTFVGATLLAGRAGNRGRRAVPGLLAHTIIPIVVGYVIAHYFSLFLFQGQQGITLLAGALDGRAAINPTVNYGLITTTGIALVQVLAVVVGHVLAVISAHDRSVALFPQAEAIIGQLPLMVLMVGYTVSGLTLLFAA
ncbi:MAG TPA: hypothetical protein VJ757_14195 [Pseudonocardiaceae bacterium]|nr:hypothetical protein [Pseudonocardiaceae bacterium]